jgi:hypothetical protein
LDRDTGRWLSIITPVMFSLGIGDYVDPNTGVGNGRFELSQLFPNSDYETQETNLFLEKMKALENKIKTDALVYSKDWFGKVHKNADVVEALWTPMLKYSKDKITGEYDYNKPPSLRSKVHIYEGVWKCEIYNEDNELLFPNDENKNITPLELLPSKEKANVATVLTCGGIWFTNGKFTVTWELAQAVIEKPEQQLLGQRKSLINLKENNIKKINVVECNNEVEKIQNKTELNVEQEQVESKHYLTDSEENEDENDEPPLESSVQSIYTPVSKAQEPKDGKKRKAITKKTIS